jgi:tetratricopeptide (TPR) repeat protein
MAQSNRNWLDFISKLSVLGTGLIAFVTAVVGFIKLWQGDVGLVTIILLAIGMGGGWLGCAYLAFRRAPPLRPGLKADWKYPRWRPWALAGLVIIPLLAAGAVGYHFYQQTQPPTKVTILIANFDGPEPQRYRVTETLLARLRAVLEPYDDMQVDALGRAITEEEGSAAARNEGKICKATIVIWGWYGVTAKAVPLSVHFEVLRPLKYMPELRPEVEGQVRKLALAELESFALQSQLTAEMSYLSLFTVGMARYEVQDWEGAIARFNDALSQTPEPIPSLDILCFCRGNAYYHQGEHDLAVADFSKAIELNPDLAEAYNNRAIAYDAKGEYAQAIADCTKAIELNPALAEAYYNRGNAYALMGQKEKAIVDFNKVLELSNDSFLKKLAEDQLEALEFHRN